MMHDIAHCNNSKCPSASRCYRFQAHLEAKVKGLEYVAYFVFDEEQLKQVMLEKRCNSFWPTTYMDNDEYDYGHNIKSHGEDYI